MVAAYDYDFLVIGSGPAGERAAIQAAKLGRRVALIERDALGGVSTNIGTIPSKTFREAVLHYSGYHSLPYSGRDAGLGGYHAVGEVGMADLNARVQQARRHEVSVAEQQLLRNGIKVLWGTASFEDEHTVLIASAGGQAQRATGAIIVISTGSYATRDPHIPFDAPEVFTSDDFLSLDHIPRTMAVVGAGVIGVEYATMFAALGTRVTLIDERPQLLPFLDGEVVEALVYQMRRSRISLRLGERVAGIEVATGDRPERVQLHLASGKELVADTALYSIGRTGATAALAVERAGLEADSRGRLTVDEHYQTAVPHIYAAGDIIGFPALAATSMEQGRLAAAHACGLPARSFPLLLPYGIYTVPEISMCGRTEEQLTAEAVPYEVGTAEYREIARGQILGDESGLLKLLIRLGTHELLGVHIIGEGATELVHIGQAVMALGGTAEYFIDAVFNYPTLAECYKTAAFDALNRAAAVEREAPPQLQHP